MRRPIFVRTEKFDMKDYEVDISTIRQCFDRYLDSYPVKTSKTKTSLMGTIGKVLQGARSGKWDIDSLTGYALNIHIANEKTKGIISHEAREALHEGVAKLLKLLSEVPITAQDKILDRLDYGLYYLRRVKGLERLEKVRQDYIVFLKEKYQTAGNLAQMWGGKPQDYGENFEKVGYPSKASYAAAKGQKKNDMSDFIKQAELKGYDFMDDEEEK